MAQPVAHVERAVGERKPLGPPQRLGQALVPEYWTWYRSIRPEDPPHARFSRMPPLTRSATVTRG